MDCCWIAKAFQQGHFNPINPALFAAHLTQAAAICCRAAAEALVALVQRLADGAQLHCSVLPAQGNMHVAGSSNSDRRSSGSAAPPSKAPSAAGSRRATPRTRGTKTSLLPMDLEVGGS
jgi:hypothetical protein